MSLAPGTRIGAYEVVDLLGVGGMGEVYRARDRRLGRDVAIKTLPESLNTDRDRLARLEREARTLAAINHPNIATIHGIEDHAGVLALVMELVEGETLQARLARSTPGRGLAPAKVRHLARQIADALEAAHEKGIVHRDLKPANIKITSDDVVKVLDFGLAKTVSDFSATNATSVVTATMGPTREGQVLGTVPYMSPEQARGQPVDARTDIWAFGCVVFEMLSGRRAFGGRTAVDTIASVLGSDVDWRALPGDVPASMRHLIRRCLDKDPRRRLRDIGDVREDLEEAPAEESQAALGASSGDGRRLTRRAALTVAGSGLLGVAAGAGVTLGGRSSVAPPPTYRRLTFRRGMIRTARFAPDFQTVLYGALWDGDRCRIYAVRPDSSESAPLNLPPGTPLAISSSGELALTLGAFLRRTMPYGTLARVPLAGGAPRELLEDVKYADWSPDGRELAVVRRTRDGERLEFPVGSVIAKPAAAGGGFSFPRVSPRGDAVACYELQVADGLTGTLTIVDRKGARRVVSAVYLNAFGLAWRGDEVWFTAAEELPMFRNAIRALGADGRVRVVARVPGNVSLHDVAPDGRVLIASTDDRLGLSVRTAGDTSERDLSWLDYSALGDMSADGRLILLNEVGVGGGPHGSTYLRGADGSLPIRLGDGLAWALSPDAKWALVRGGSRPHLDLVPTGAGQLRRIERPGLTLSRGRWTPDGRRLVVRGELPDRRARLYLLAVDGEGTVPITPEGTDVGLDAWSLSPDGTQVAVQSSRGLEILPIAGGPARPGPALSGQDELIGWIDSGLLVSPDPEAAGPVFRTDLASGRRELWRDIEPRDPTGIMHLNLRGLRVTPDGRSYGYSWARAISDLYLVEGWA